MTFAFNKLARPLIDRSPRVRYEDKYLEGYDFFYQARRTETTLVSNSTFEPVNKISGRSFLNHDATPAQSGIKTPKRKHTNKRKRSS